MPHHESNVRICTTTSQCPSLPYPLTLFNADSASAECSATTIGSQPDECRFSFWTIRDSRWRNVEVRTCKYLNNIVEQDHRAIKRRCASMAGFKSFDNAAITLAGIELAHRIHKRQFSFGIGRPRRERSLKVLWDRALS